MNEAIQGRGENTIDLLIMNDKDIVYKDSVMTPTIATISNDTDVGYFGVQEFLRCTSEENNKQELNSDNKDKEILVRLEEGDPKTLLYLQEEDKDSVTCLKEGSRDTLVSLEDRLTVHGSNLSRPKQEKLSSNVTQNVQLYTLMLTCWVMLRILRLNIQ
uniref:Uncharacterized protein n=1 Tax=Biomphalaria glabrata TaxID=6526 RepID=A0A2C9KNZ8_BIOGL